MNEWERKKEKEKWWWSMSEFRVIHEWNWYYYIKKIINRFNESEREREREKEIKQKEKDCIWFNESNFINNIIIIVYKWK